MTAKVLLSCDNTICHKTIDLDLHYNTWLTVTKNAPVNFNLTVRNKSLNFFDTVLQLFVQDKKLKRASEKNTFHFCGYQCLGIWTGDNLTNIRLNTEI